MNVCCAQAATQIKLERLRASEKGGLPAHAKPRASATHNDVSEADQSYCNKDAEPATKHLRVETGLGFFRQDISAARITTRDGLD
ncbi:hypothetical protein CGZ80_25765 [Rhodopirellula sp. MGV]|nr:hypothetical protein CGZ80_25765 [Rhodopirellula sp. MGV]PNY36916.1 hypothetical protein C2E31_09840 [Rhodopirellula baltica]